MSLPLFFPHGAVGQLAAALFALLFVPTGAWTKPQSSDGQKVRLLFHQLICSELPSPQLSSLLIDLSDSEGKEKEGESDWA